MYWRGVRDFNGKNSEKSPHRRFRHIWEPNINMGLMKIAVVEMKWLHLAKDMFQWRAVVHKVMNEI